MNIEATTPADTDDASQWGIKLSARTLTELIYEKNKAQGMIAPNPKVRDTPSKDGWVAAQREMDRVPGVWANPFMRLIGALAYVAQTVRWDCIFTTAQNQRIQQSPSEQQYRMLQTRTLTHMYETRRRGVKYKQGSYQIQIGPKEWETVREDELVAFTDSSHADIPDVCPCAKC